MMRMFGWMTTGAMALLAAAGLAAQTSTTTSRRNTSAADRLTVTGCIERADQISQTGALGTTVDSLDFVLIKTNAGRSAARRPQKERQGRQARPRPQPTRRWPAGSIGWTRTARP